MFFIDKDGGMHITRGDSVTLATELYTAENVPLRLNENSCVIFTVRSKASGKLKIKRILTDENYDDDELIFNILPEETLIEPAKYDYSFLYLPNKYSSGQAYTYAQGDFEIMHTATTYKDKEV